MSGASFGKQGSKPQFFSAQSDNANQAIEQLLLPRLFGGSPDVASQANQARAADAQAGALERQGLTGSGLAAKSVADSTSQFNQAQDRALLDILARLLTPQGNKSSGINIGVPA